MRRRALAVAVLIAAPLTVAAPAEAATTCAGHRVTMSFGPADNRSSGTPHADVITAGAGDDIVDGGGGNDTLHGELDALVSQKIYIDQCAFPPPPDYCVYTHLEGDTLRGGPGNDRLMPGYATRETTEPRESGGVHYPPWEGSSPSFRSSTYDELRWDTSTHAVSVDLTRRVATGEGTDKIVAGGRYAVFTSAHNDVVVGTEGPDFIETGPGSDRVMARGGDDHVRMDGTGSTQRDADAAYGVPATTTCGPSPGPTPLRRGRGTTGCTTTVGPTPRIGCTAVPEPTYWSTSSCRSRGRSTTAATTPWTCSTRRSKMLASPRPGT